MKHPFAAIVTVALTLLLTPMAHAADPFWRADATDSVHAITVYRTASCGCCKGWVSHLRDHHFDVDEVVLADLREVRQRLGVSPELASCHTAESGNYVFEGHVPAADIKAVLEGSTRVRLLSVPAMPSGTPGMDFPGARKDAFDVVAEDRDGSRHIYRSYPND